MRFFQKRRYLSPLLLLFILVTCSSGVFGKHRIRHHRDRFKRQQGAHLYLPESYVSEGGDGPDVGPWQQWSAPSPCSRSCGGGVSTVSRECTPGYTCQGPTARHFSCNTQDCPDIGDFRAQQCSEFDSVPFNGVLYQWIPYTKAPNPCELNCMPRGERFYYRHRDRVVDGTRCNDESPDLCIQGKCQPVGCDMMLGSSAREDLCRICRGNGSTCNTVRGRLDMQDLQVGYNDVLLIPSGATNIQVQEIAPSNNYLAVRNSTGHYYLNGNWRIDFPRTMEFAGCKFHYERYPQGFSAPDKITCLGPIDESLFIVLLYQDRNVGIDYEYSLPSDIQPGYETETYAWTFDQFSPCSQTCGGGIQHRNVSCAGRQTLDTADRSLCDSNNEPVSSQKCAEIPCQAQWAPYPWDNCSAPCGEGGVQSREVACQQIISNGYPSLVDEAECLKLSSKPPTRQECNKGKVCAKWHTGPWKPCDHLCGEGKERRRVQCYRDENSKIEVMDDSECISVEPKPQTERKCNLRPCEGVDWITSVWSGCDKCGLTNETRKVQCATSSGVVYADDLCDADQKPELIRQCNATKPTCDYNWYASQWSECSAQCGQGVQTRTLFCGVVTDDGTVQKVENEKCDNNRTYETIRNCTGEMEKCGGEWYSGPWTECSKQCGGGERSKKVVCLKDLQVVDASECGPDKIIFGKEECNTQPCSEDTIIPTDVTKSIDEFETVSTEEVSTTEETKEELKDDSEYEIVASDECDDGEWVDAEPSKPIKDESKPMADEQLGGSTESSVPTEETDFSIDDLMLSDAPSSPLESEATQITSSGDGDITTGTSFGSAITESSVEGSGDTESTLSTIETDTSTSTIYSRISESEATTTSESAEPTTESSRSSESASSSDFTTASSDITTSSLDTTYFSSEENTPSSDVTTESSQPTDDTKETESTVQTTEQYTVQTTESSTSTEVSEVATSTDSTETQFTTSSTDATTSSHGLETSESTIEAQTTTEQSEFSTTPSSTEEIVEVIGESNFGSELETTKKTTDLRPTEESDSTEITTTVSVSGGSSVSIGSGLPVTFSTEFEGDTETTTEFTGETETATEFIGTTESPASTESTTEYTETIQTTEFDIWSSTTESSSEETTEWGTTPITAVFESKPRMCKRKKQKSCKDTLYGCCWDKITAAEGPFDKGCPNPKTCNESKYGCCEDGVSPALGRKFMGCPPTHCNETLFGCCPDNKTASEGNNREACPPPPPACFKSKYGCCEDNATEAKGPKYKGCEEEEVITIASTTFEPEDCNSTTYGCCPDGVQAAHGEFYKGCVIENCTESYFRCCPDGNTAADGPNYQGCKTPCSDKEFGCCPDGNTPAHGRNGEGCCLASPYGCCPDNILPARGPNLEGCGCQYSPYRCCPDNVTAARGYNNEGCGCQYTEHGCCPDEYTPAGGPDYQGCLCHTFQFGCCPDGITVAKGPHQQGCGCRNTQFGCCSDDSTPARGPNYAGCGCDSSKFGCCPDGTTDAGGDNFEGCKDILPNLQESCIQPKERGSCRNYTVKWFFDTDYGGCSRFWYGGCDGNDNRFRSKDECEGICVKPEGIDRCKLPKVPGPCEGYYPQWYYDTQRKHCAQFIYGGCLGNNNRFETREECMLLCVKDDSVDACEQNKDEGPCKGNYLRWYFDKQTKTCQQFIYGGCKSNNNNFPTEEACKQHCSQSGRKKDHCSLPRAQGNCTGREPKWYYDIPEKQCLPFYYSGCNGNNNNFNSREACEADCPKEIVKDLCQLAADIGTCANYSERWYYDTKEKSCRQFYYGGCGGNGNNFETNEQCEGRCSKRHAASQAPQTQEQPFTTEMCFLPSQTGDCRNAELRYFYDRADGICKRFTYGGCGGNQNNFASVELCWQNCANAQDLCNLPAVVGPCDSELEQFYYDARTDSCLSFKYGGCEGNYNRFPDRASCEQRCRRSAPTPPQIQTQAPPAEQQPSNVAMCYEQPDTGNCTDNLSVYFYNSSTGVCTPFTYTGCGGNGNRFASEEQCERQCGNFRGQDVCNMPQDVGPCRGYFVKYYYEKAARRCAQFAYGGCGGNGNRFSSNEECESICVTHEEKRSNVTSTAVCELPVDMGSCQDGYHRRWYFDNARGECIAFIFSGCGGNLNNFKTFQSCVDFCRDYLTVTQPPVGPDDHPCQTHFDECATLRCPYGIEAYVDENQCNRCQCLDPCSKVDCVQGRQCAMDFNRNKTSAQDPDYVAVCREINKEGKCPNLERREGSNCEQECRNDADCSLQLKCCSTGCGTSCIEPILEVPAELVTQQSLPAYTEPALQGEYYSPKLVETFEPQIQGLIGDQVTLHCAVTGNPVPKISWRKGDLLIDGTQAKYRIKLDQSLQIITLHKTDSGVYLCTADNSVGEPVTNEIKLDVIDGPPRPATVLESEDQPNVVVSLNAPATLRCQALGFPFPAVTWWKENSLIPLKTNHLEVRQDYSLLIHSVKLSDLGIYTCQAYNGIGKAASWSVAVKARGPYYSTNPKDQKYLKFIVNPPELPTVPQLGYRPPPAHYRPPANNEINPHEGPAPHPAAHIVPVKTNITSDNRRFPTGSEITLPCAVEGFPQPQVQWYKDGVPIATSERTYVSDIHTLTISQATKADSGMYQCEATNSYSTASSAVQILVDGMYIHPNCKDNQFFAKCSLIVQARYCSHKYYAKFCCRSCTEAGLLPVDGPHLHESEKQTALLSNLV